MTSRISSGLEIRAPGTGFASARDAPKAGRPNLVQQVEQELFGRHRPIPVELEEDDTLTALFAKLRRAVRQIAMMQGDHPDDYLLVPAAGANAHIDHTGKIFLGVGLVKILRYNLAALVGIIGHEIGHRPKKWYKRRRYRGQTLLDMQAVLRQEETIADITAGKALAELDGDPAPMCSFLAQAQSRPHPEYFPPDIRAQIIWEAYHKRLARCRSRKKLFPYFDRMTSARGDVGIG